MAKEPSFGNEPSKTVDDLTNQMSETEVLDDKRNEEFSSNCFPSTSKRGKLENVDEDINIKKWLIFFFKSG